MCSAQSVIAPFSMETTFHGLEFLTAPGRVFTPRATTEALVDAALAHIDGQPVRIADVGTGTGVIGVTIAVESPNAEVWATDTSGAAVELARANAERHGVADRVHVIQGDLLEPVPESVDLVVANLPYLPAGPHPPADDPAPPGPGYPPRRGARALPPLPALFQAGNADEAGVV